MAEEKRKSVRIKKLITVRYSFGAGQGEKRWDITSVRDLSETGMCVTTQQVFACGDLINFLIKIPSRPLEWIELTGKVVGSVKSTALSGESLSASHITRVEFINLKNEQKELIREYITWFLSKEGGGKR